MKNKIILIHGIFVLLLGGCLPEISGDPPPSDQLIYPVGLAATANDKYLLVANSNFDLRYNAGTLVAIDLEELGKIKEGGGKKEWISPDGNTLYIPADELIDEKSTLRMDAFASDLTLTSKGNRALIPVRGGAERHILIVDVEEKEGRVLSCGEDDDLKCNGAHKVTSDDRFTLPIEPYAVATLDYSWQYEDDEGNTSISTSTLGFSTHLYTGSVSAFVIENNEGKLDPKLIGVANGVIPEANGIAVNTNSNEIYVSGKENAEKYIAILKVMHGYGGSPTKDPYFGPLKKALNYSKDLYGATDTRGIAVNTEKNEALVVTRNPNALMRFDLDSNSREMIDMVSLGEEPSVIKLFEDDGKTYAFVLCFDDNSVYIVDTDTMQSYVRTTGLGPHAITFDKQQKHAFIANFRESTITVIEATPPFKHVQVEDKVGKGLAIVIGRPRLPQDHN